MNSIQCLLPSTNIDKMLDEYLMSDIPKFDIGGHVVGDIPKIANLYMKSPGKLCGIPFFDHIFKKLNCKVTWFRDEGYVCSDDEANKKLMVAKVEGPACNILRGERTALNILSRASGISTLSNQVKNIAYTHNWNGEVAGTRKTTPGFSLIEKYALLVGGCSTHRMDLSSMVMLKDNHIWSTGSITNSVNMARSVGGFSIKIEVECQTLQDGLEAAQAGAEIVMLDNFESTELKEVSQIIKNKYPNVIIEASGGIKTDNIHHYFSPNVDVISLGLLTQGYDTLDFSLKIQKN